MFKFGHLDLAIICAGVGELNPDLDLSTELATLSVNVNGWTNAVGSIYKIFEIQNISSDFAIFYVPNLFIYINLTTFAVLIPGSP